jgi:hypothetical protein
VRGHHTLACVCGVILSVYAHKFQILEVFLAVLATKRAEQLTEMEQSVVACLSPRLPDHVHKPPQYFDFRFDFKLATFCPT